MKRITVEGARAPECPYCHVPAVLFRGEFGRRWECPQFDCDARVGVHRDSPHATPLGTLARAPLRELRRQVHEAFDPLWRNGERRRFPSRSAAYSWLANRLELRPQRCHIGEFDEASCARALAAIHHLHEVPR